MQQPPAKIGDALADVDTPALLVDLDAFEENLKRLSDFAKAKGLKLRPHAKTHKSPVVALKQIALGAVGQCCQKLGEAEVLAQGGVKDILISNQIVGATKLERLAALAREVKLGVCVDDLENAKAISAALVRYDAHIEMLVEITAGMERCGIAPGQPAADLAKAASQLPHVTFGGIQAYHGSAQHKRTPDERRAAIEVAADAVSQTKKALAALGLPCPRVTGAGTGTFELEAASGLWDELQCGSYAFMDADYARNLEADGRPFTSFKHSLFLWATVMSRPTPTRAVCDVGLKSTSAESGLPTVPDLVDVTYVGASDEHGTLKLGPKAPALALGTKIKLIPGHCDPTINLHDWYVGIRKGRVEALWPIAARGLST